MTREDAWSLVNEYAKSDSLLRHSIAVEAAMKAYATKQGEDQEIWGIAGMLHDFDWDICPSPEDHPQFGASPATAARPASPASPASPAKAARAARPARRAG